MPEDNTDQPLAGEQPGSTSASNGAPAAFVQPDPATRAGDSVLDLDELMSAGRRAERTARFCIDGAAYARLLEIDEEIEALDRQPGYADPDDEPMAGDELSRLVAERREVLPTVQAAMRTVRVRALPDEEWRALLRRYDHDKSPQKALSNDRFWDEMVTKCAIAPTLDAAAVAKLRSTLALAQLDQLHGACWQANTADGVDIPKSPGFLREMKRKERASS